MASKRFMTMVMVQSICTACDHRNHVGSCPCSTKGCSCLRWRLTSYARILPAVFGG